MGSIKYLCILFYIKEQEHNTVASLHNNNEREKEQNVVSLHGNNEREKKSRTVVSFIMPINGMIETTNFNIDETTSRCNPSPVLFYREKRKGKTMFNIF